MAENSPGRLVKIEVPVTVSVLLGLSVIVLTALYVLKPKWDNGIVFFGTSTGVAAGILGAFYVGKGLQVTIEQRDQGLLDDRISRAFGFVRCWNDPNLGSLRASWRTLLDEISGKTGDEVCAILEDRAKRTIAADVLNFFEELSYAARCGVADTETLRRSLGSVLKRYFAAAWPWIEKNRRDKHQPTAFEHLQWLHDQWKNL